jgi:hypothetical protein
VFVLRLRIGPSPVPREHEDASSVAMLAREDVVVPTASVVSSGLNFGAGVVSVSRCGNTFLRLFPVTLEVSQHIVHPYRVASGNCIQFCGNAHGVLAGSVFAVGYSDAVIDVYVLQGSEYIRKRVMLSCESCAAGPAWLMVIDVVVVAVPQRSSRGRVGCGLESG